VDIECYRAQTDGRASTHFLSFAFGIGVMQKKASRNNKAEKVFAAFDALRSGYAVFDENDALIYHNEHFRRTYLSFQLKDNLLGMKFEDIIRLKLDNGEIAGELAIGDPEAWVRKRLERHRTRQSETEQRLADGRWLSIKERRISGGGTIGQWIDITEAKKSSQLLEDAVESTADGFAIWDQKGRLSLYNTLFAERMGYSNKEVHADQPLKSMLTDLASSEKLCLDMTPSEWVEHYMIARRNPISEQVLEFDDGTFFMMRERRNRDGGHAMVLTDITDMKKKERALVMQSEDLQKAIEEIEMSRSTLEDQAGQLIELAEDREMARELAEKERERAENLRERARANEAKFMDMAANVPGVIFQWYEHKDGTRGYSYVSPRSCDILGILTEDLVANYRELKIHDDDIEKWKNTIKEALDKEQEWIFEGRFIHPHKGERWYRAVAKPVRATWEEMLFNGVIIDITHQKELENELRRLAKTDPLTGAQNRRAFLESVQAEEKQWEGGRTSLSVLNMDLDHFKKINDTHGHAVGDETLKMFVSSCQEMLDGDGVLGRLGGEEFAALLPGFDKKKALGIGEKLRKKIAKTKVVGEKEAFNFTVSIGVAEYGADGANIDKVLQSADDALYRAKEKGRNRTVSA
jgi:diguanylate cyclase (GGDEF)-like protein/PAS domain S-box-containing protein